MMQLRLHPTPYRFMPHFERMEPLILDHTAIINAKMCMRKYFFAIVLGMNPRGAPAPYFSFGSAYHKYREVLEIKYQELCKQYEIKTLSSDKKNAIYNACHLIASKAGLDYFKEATGGKAVPVGDKWDFLTEGRLVKSFEAAFDHWKREKFQNKIEVLAIEQPFNVEIVPGSGEYTSGRFDQIIRWNGRVWGRDWKTSSKEGMFYSRGLDPNDQFTRYTFSEQELAGTRVEGQFIEVLYNSKKKGPEITVYTSSRTQWQLDDWKADEMFMRETIRRAREQDRWPKQEHSCGFCQFHSVCKMGNESAQMNTLKQHFEQRAWNNMTVHLLESEK